MPVDAEEHRAWVTGWAERRLAEMAAPDSWLALIGLHWLSEGETTVGSGGDNDIVLPAKADAHVGTVILEGEQVRFVVAEGVRVTQGVDSTLSLPVGTGARLPDMSGDPAVMEATLGYVSPGHATVLRHGDLNWVLVRRGDRFALRVRDNAHPAYEEFTDIERFPTSADWHVTARWVPHDKTVAVPNVLGTISDTRSPAYLEFWVDGERHTLDVTGKPDHGKYMLVFADSTSGQETYGGGRYLWVAEPDESNRVVMDFNLAYNPPCVFTDFATCPLPTRDNRLAMAVEAGEKYWTH
jgi:uncharacterized protein (DUF1684 family)